MKYKFVGKNKKELSQIFICLGLVTIVVFSMIDFPIASALWTETQYCGVEDCHENDEPTTWIQITETGQTAGEISFDVTGSDNYDGEEGWAVFDPLMNNIANGNNSGSFILPKSGWTYRVFWVDNETDGPRGSAYADVYILNDYPILELDGPTKVKVGTTHTYTFSVIDPQDQLIYLLLDWGDGSDTGWMGPYESGEEDSRSHAWTVEGTYTITLYAKDEYDAESSISLRVQVPKNKPYFYNFPILNWLFERFPNAFPILRYLLDFQ